MKNSIYIVLTFIAMCSFQVHGQLEDLQPKSPEASTLINNIEAPVGKYTGTFSYTVPLGTVTKGPLSISPSLQYRGTSFKNADIASSAGLGWDLSNGSFITRKVNGLPDEHEYGFLNTRNSFTYQQILDFEIANDKASIKDYFIEGCWDTRPDEFYFNINGVTGTFVFPWDPQADIIVSCSAPIKIEGYTIHPTDVLPHGDVFINNPIATWVLIDHNGIKYKFEEFETTSTIGGNPPCAYGVPEVGDIVYYGHSSSWYLTNVEDLSNPNNFLELTYIDNNYETQSLPIEIANIPDPTESDINCWLALGDLIQGQIWNTNAHVNFQNTVITSKSLSKVMNGVGDTIIFYYNNDRSDVEDANRLDSVKTISGNQHIATYELKYYSDNNKKLLLKEVKTKSEDNTIAIPPYQFEYNNPVRHADHAFSCDHWGYPNESTTSTNMPRFVVANPNFANGFFEFQGSDRNPSLEGSKSYTMKKITFPTGGYKEFEYELNTATNVNGAPLDDVVDDQIYDLFDQSQKVSKGLFYQGVPYINNAPNYNFSCGLGANQDSCDYGSFEIINPNYDPNQPLSPSNGTLVTFSFDGLMCQEFTVSVNATDNGNNFSETFIFFPGGGDPVNCLNPDDPIVFRVFMPPGEYIATIQDFRVQLGWEDQWLRGTVEYYNGKFEVDSSGIEYRELAVGGVRVKNVKTFNENGTLEHQVNYDYSFDNGRSSGVIYGFPIYHDESKRLAFSTYTSQYGFTFYNWNDNGCAEWAIMSSSKASFGTTKGSHIGYAYVKEYNSGTGTVGNYKQNPNGYVATTFSSPREYPDIITKRRPYTHAYSQSYMTGLITKQEIFGKDPSNGNHILVKTDTNVYQAMEQFAECITISEGVISKAGPLARYVAPNSTYSDPWPGLPLEAMWLTRDFHDVIAFDIRKYRLGYPNLTKSKTTTYNTDGNEPITNISSNTYDIYNNLKKTFTWRETDNDFTLNGEDHILSEYFYLHDGEGYSAGSAYISDDMRQRNMVGIPFKTQVSQKIGASPYQLVSGNKSENINFYGKIVLRKTYEVENGTFYPKSRVDLWDNRGNPTIIKSYRVGGASNLSVLDDNFLEITWNPKDQIEEYKMVSDLGEQITTYDYNNSNSIERITDYNGQITEFDYDKLLRLKETRSGKAVGETNFRKWTTYTYNYKLDQFGNTIAGANNEVITTDHFLPANGIAIPNQLTKSIMDDFSRELRIVKPAYLPDGTDAILSSSSYDQYGRLSTKTELGKGSTTYGYENSPLGRTIDITNTIGVNTTKIGYNLAPITIENNVYPTGTLSKQTIIDSDGSKTVIFNDFLGREVQTTKYVTHNGVLTKANTKKIYDNQNRLIKVIPPSGGAYEYNYNERGWLKSKKIPTQTNPQEFFYDQWGRQAAFQDPMGQITATQFDDLGREIAKGELNSLTFIDQNNHIVSIPNSGLDKVYGNIVYETSATGNPMDWIDYTTQANMATLNQSNPEFYMTNYTYDNIGRIETIEQDNHKGGVETTSNFYNNANMIYRSELSHNTHNTNFGEQININWDYTFDHGLRTENMYIETPGMSTPQLVTNLVYNNKLQIAQKNLHQNGNDYWQTIDYLYDNAGRLININNLEDVNNEDCLADNYCDLHIPLTKRGSNKVVIQSINYLDEITGETPITGITFPFTLTNSSLNTLKSSIENWLTTQGYLYDEVIIAANLDLITITQSNAPITSTKQDDNTNEITISNCCGNKQASDLFAEVINYPSAGTTIQSLEWGTTCNGFSKYAYQYDELKRIKKASYYSKNLAADGWLSPGGIGMYGMNVSYDLIGNISTLKRNGKVNGSAIQIDNLTYHYNPSTDRLDQVTDGISANHLTHGQKGNTSFMYDDNGNVTIEQSRGITIDYNVFDLPETITKTATGDKIENVFLGNEARIQKVITTNGELITRDYIGAFQYETKDGITKLEAAYLDFGRIVFKQNGANRLEYSIKDHLGNIRVNFTDRDNDGIISKADVLQENHQYPFGLMMNEMGSPTIGTSNDYAYNGKELDEELELNWYNYGARFYDPALARWHSVDPLADDIKQIDKSVYAYTWNNPISLIDPDGKYPDDPPVAVVKAKYDRQKFYRNSEGNLVRRGPNNPYNPFTEGGRDTRYHVKTLPGNKDVNFDFGIPEEESNGAHKFDGNFNMGKHERWNETGGVAISIGEDISLANASVDTRLGTILLGIHGSAEGRVMAADANLDLGLLIEQNNQTGLVLDANVGAYIAEGEVSWGTQLLGVKVSTTLGGSYGSAHAGITIKAAYDHETGYFVLEGMEHLGLGIGEKAGAKVEIPMEWLVNWIWPNNNKDK